jgi:hypothetical protein
MANVRAISAVCKAVIHLLESAYEPSDFNNDLEFKVYTASNFATPMTAGVSLFLYRLYHNGTYRNPPGRLLPNGRRARAQLPVDLHLMLTVWGGDASLEHAIAGWMMRTLEDQPMLPAGMMNAVEPGAFRSDEIVEIAPAEILTEDLLRLWEGLVAHTYHLSIPYLARTVRIDSQYAGDGQEYDFVQERRFDFHDGTPPQP